MAVVSHASITPATTRRRQSRQPRLSGAVCSSFYFHVVVVVFFPPTFLSRGLEVFLRERELARDLSGARERRRQEAGMLLGGNQDSASVSWNRTTTWGVAMATGGGGDGRRGGGEEERWQTQNYLAACLRASLVCAPLHMFNAYETRSVINRLVAAANSHCGKITGKPAQSMVSMSRKSTSEAEFGLLRAPCSCSSHTTCLELLVSVW